MAALSFPLVLSFLVANAAPPVNADSSSSREGKDGARESTVLASSPVQQTLRGGGGGPSSGFHSAVHLARKKTSRQRRTHYPYVIIGAGTTAFAAVEAILKYERNAKILMLTDESSLPLTMIDIHNAEKLSPDLLFSYSEWRRHVSSRLESEPEAFTRHPVTLMLGRKRVKLDVEKKVLLLDDGGEVLFDRCLVATAGKPRQFYVLDLEKSAYFLRDRVNLLSSLADFEALNSLQDAMECRHVCVVGGGFLGTEVALSMSARGLKVSQVYAETAPLSRHLPLYLAEYIKDRLTEVGVEAISERLVTSVRCGDGPDDVEKIYVSVMGWANDLLTTDYVVLASTHIDPVTTVAADSGLEIDPSNGGIMVNSQMEAVNGVFAAGACASFFDPALGRRRLDRYEHGVYSGQLAGHNMVMTGRSCHHAISSMRDSGKEGKEGKEEGGGGGGGQGGDRSDMRRSSSKSSRSEGGSDAELSSSSKLSSASKDSTEAYAAVRRLLDEARTEELQQQQPQQQQCDASGGDGSCRPKQLEVLHGGAVELSSSTSSSSSSNAGSVVVGPGSLPSGPGTGAGAADDDAEANKTLPPVEIGDDNGVVVMRWNGRMKRDMQHGQGRLPEGAAGVSVSGVDAGPGVDGPGSVSGVSGGTQGRETLDIGSFVDLMEKDDDGELVNAKGLAREDRSCALQEMPPYSQVYRHQPMFRSRLEALDIVMEGVGELESNMRTVGIWLDGKHGSKGLLERKVGEQQESFERGIVYYLSGSVVKGILLYNADDLKDEATQVIMRQPNVRSVNELKALVALAPDNWLRIVETNAVGENM